MKQFSGHPYPAAYTDTREDRLAARVLADLGLLPRPLDQADSHGEPYLTTDDPLVGVVAPALARAGGTL